jgi:hypothetical protein
VVTPAARRWLLLASVAAAAAGCVTSEGGGRREWGPEGGIFVTYHFGHGSAVGWAAGFEGRVSRKRVCPDDLTSFAGAALRAQWLDDGQARLVAAPLYGGNSRYSQVSGELALGWDLGGPHPGPVVQPGLDTGLVGLTTKVSYAVARDLSMGLGLRLPATLCWEDE